MSDSLLVRTSRDGDQFHYLWAARRALRLLKPQSTLVALTIEGASTTEMGSQPVVEDGEELIDIAEYYGSNELATATTVKAFNAALRYSISPEWVTKNHRRFCHSL